MNSIKLQLAISIAVTFILGVSVGMYAASQIVGSILEANK